jgi:hypothetical protein
VGKANVGYGTKRQEVGCRLELCKCKGTITMKILRVTSLALCLSAACAFAQTPVEPGSASIKNPNPANSGGSTDEGNDPLGRAGEHSPTGWNSQLDATTGMRSNGPDGRAPENKDRTVNMAPAETGIPQQNPNGRPIQQPDGGGTGVPDTR